MGNTPRDRRRAPVPFPLGHTVMTRGAQAALERAGEDPLTYLSRHAFGDWGDVCEEDWQENELSLEKGFRLLSAYHTSAGDKLWIITEWDRSATTILLPDEY